MAVARKLCLSVFVLIPSARARRRIGRAYGHVLISASWRTVAHPNRATRERVMTSTNRDKFTARCLETNAGKNQAIHLRSSASIICHSFVTRSLAATCLSTGQFPDSVRALRRNRSNSATMAGFAEAMSCFSLGSSERS